MIELLLAVLFGRSEALASEAIRIGPEEGLLKASRTISPVSDTMTVFVGLGMPSEDVSKNLFTPAGRSTLPKVKVQICKADLKCFASTSSGPYLMKNEYGIEFAFNPADVKSHLPFGRERQHWAPDALAREDVKIQAARELWVRPARKAAENLFTRFSWAPVRRQELARLGVRGGGKGAQVR
jgi:hypothetical protein